MTSISRRLARHRGAEDAEAQISVLCIRNVACSSDKSGSTRRDGEQKDEQRRSLGVNENLEETSRLMRRERSRV